MAAYTIHPSAIVDEGAQIGEGSRIWHFVHVCGGARIGKGVSLGQNVFVGNKVVIGDHCKVQNHVSIYDNVTLGIDSPERDRLLAAVEQAGLKGLIGSHADGLAMPVGEGGRRLSGGQRQGVALARALMPDSSILLLDEPTSAMDSVMENQVSQSLGQLSRGKSLMLVTHRTSLLHMVERLIILDAGHVVADGPKQTVLDELNRGVIQRKSR